jgi:hypothetical protein
MKSKIRGLTMRFRTTPGALAGLAASLVGLVVIRFPFSHGACLSLGC